MKKIAVIVAGGSGQRMGSSLPKQFLMLQGQPLLWHTLQRFLNAYADMSVILVLPEPYLALGKEIIAATDAPDRVTLCAGGATRFHSVQNGLQLIREEAIVFVHDGVRCLISNALIHRCYEQALEKGSAIPTVPATDSIRVITEGKNKPAPRDHIHIVQTPQTFASSILLPAFKVAYQEGFTDEATVVEAAGIPVHLIEGDYHNVKITRPIDLLMAEKILSTNDSVDQ